MANKIRWPWARGAEVPNPYQQSSTNFLTFLGPQMDPKPIKTKTDQLDANAGWIYAATNAIAQDVRRNPWGLWKVQGKHRREWEQLDDKSIPLVLKRPNALQTWGDLIELTQLHLDYTGEAYWNLITDQPGGTVRGIQILYPHWVTEPVFSEDRKRITHWKLNIPGAGTPQMLPAEDVVVFRYPHPKNPLVGASPVEAFAVSYNMDMYARVYGSALLKNRAIPDIVISTDEAISDRQAQALADRWKDRYSGRPGEPAVLGKGAKVQVLAGHLKDLAFLDLAQLTREQILAIYKIPASKLGVSGDVNRATAVEASRSYNENCILPRLTRVAEVISVRVLPRLLPKSLGNVVFEFESPVEEEETIKIARAKTALAAGAIKVNEFRGLIGLEPTPDGEVYLLPANLVPTTNLQDAANRAEESAKAGLDAAKNLAQQQPKTQDQQDQKTGKDQPKPATKALRSVPDPTEQDLELASLRYNQALDKEERTLRNSVRSLLSREQKEILKRLRAEMPVRSMGNLPSIVEIRDWLTDAVEQQRQEWETVLQNALIQAQRSGWNLATWELADKRSSWDGFEVLAKEWARREAAFEAAFILEHTRLRISQILSDAIASEQETEATVKQVAELYDDWKGSRANTIANTEAASGLGRGKRQHILTSVKHYGLNGRRTWVTVLDGRERQEHGDVHGQTRGINEPYDVSGHSLAHPGDPAAPARLRINCRCTELYLFEKEEEQ